MRGVAIVIAGGTIALALPLRRQRLGLGFTVLALVACVTGALGCDCSDWAMRWTGGPEVSKNVVCVGETVTVTATAADKDLIEDPPWPACPLQDITPTVSGTGPYTFNTPGVHKITVTAVDPTTPYDDDDLSVDLFVTAVEVASVSGP